MRSSPARAVILLIFLVFGHAAASGLHPQDKETPLKITSKPQASAEGCGGAGRAVVKVTFDKSGKVSEAMRIRSSGCGPFDNSAVRAALQIRFEPARKNGVPVTVTRPVEYTYSVY